MSRKSTYQKGVEEELARQLELHVKNDPDCFVKDRISRDKLLARFEINRSILKQYPEVIKAMFLKTGDVIPKDLLVENIVSRDQ